MASVADVPTLPASVRVVENVLPTVSAVTLAMSPPPLTAVTITFLTVSIIPGCVVFMPVFLSVCPGFHCRLVRPFTLTLAPANSDPVVVLLFLGLLNGHAVDHALDTVDVGDELGDQGLFGFVLGLATHRDHAIVGRDLGLEHAGRAMRQQ